MEGNTTVRFKGRTHRICVYEAVHRDDGPCWGGFVEAHHVLAFAHGPTPRLAWLRCLRQMVAAVPS